MALFFWLYTCITCTPAPVELEGATRESSTLNKKWAKWGKFHYSSHTGMPKLPSFPKGTLWNFNWHHSMCWVLMSISQTVFNSLAASPLTPTRNFKRALLWIPQSCIKNFNLGDMLTIQLHMLPNSNEDSDHSSQRRKEESTMPVDLSIWPSVCLLHESLRLRRKIVESRVPLKKAETLLTFTVRNQQRHEAKLFVLQHSCLHIVQLISKWLDWNKKEPLIWCDRMAKKEQHQKHSEAELVLLGLVWLLLT